MIVTGGTIPLHLKSADALKKRNGWIKYEKETRQFRTVFPGKDYEGCIQVQPSYPVLVNETTGPEIVAATIASQDH